MKEFTIVLTENELQLILQTVETSTYAGKISSIVAGLLDKLLTITEQKEDEDDV